MPQSTGTYTWQIETFSKLPQVLYYSPKFEVGGYVWRLELSPPKFGGVAKNYVGISLRFVEAEITPDRDCPSASVRFVAVSRRNASESLETTAQHTFTRDSPDWGFPKFIPMGNLRNRKAALLVRDALCVTATIQILKHPLKNSQSLVSFDVGGKIFKMDEETLARYSDSKLPKMVKQCRGHVQNGTPIYIDRDPKTFPWIREIYRNGDYETILPSSSKKLLQRELNFFQLPSLEGLGIEDADGKQSSEVRV